MASSTPFRIDPSMTSAFKALDDAVLAESVESRGGPPISGGFIGGGPRAPGSRPSVLERGHETSAVVAMADDGGSTGLLREAADVTPPGDVRKCIAAFADDPYDPLVKAFKYRLEIADGHALGNLMLAALEDASGSFVKAIEICETLLRAQGHVYPSTLDHVTLCAETRDGQVLDGQAVALRSEAGASHISANKAAIRAILDADLVVLGPGSLFTSIIPNILVPGILEAVRQSEAAVLFVCSLADAQGETWGLTAREHYQALVDHRMGGLIDFMLVHTPVPLRAESPGMDSFIAASGDEGANASTADLEDLQLSGSVRPVRVHYQDVQAIQSEGTVVLARNLADAEHPTWHSPAALREAVLQVMKLARARRP